jgi:hypothetical protein
MYCIYCHPKLSFSECKCYIIDMGDSFTCTQCNRSQIDMVYTSKKFDTGTDFGMPLKNYNVIYELCGRLNLN